MINEKPKLKNISKIAKGIVHRILYYGENSIENELPDGHPFSVKEQRLEELSFCMGVFYRAGYKAGVESEQVKNRVAPPIGKEEYEKLASKINLVFLNAFTTPCMNGEDTRIIVRPNVCNRAQVFLQWAVLNNMSENEKEDFLWDIIKAKEDIDHSGISFILGYGTNESFDI